MYDMYIINAALPDLQCLLWTFAGEMKTIDVIVILKGTNSILTTSVRTLLLEYCYEKEFKHL